MVRQAVENQVLTVEGAVAHAVIMELGKVEFLNSEGTVGARGADVAYVRVIFIDGKLCTMSHKDFIGEMSNVTFMLRPVIDNA